MRLVLFLYQFEYNFSISITSFLCNRSPTSPNEALQIEQKYLKTSLEKHL